MYNMNMKIHAHKNMPIDSWVRHAKICLSGPEVIEKMFMLNSAEHEIFSANKYENANNSWHFHIY